MKIIELPGWLSVGIFYCYCKTYNNKSKTTTISFVKYLLRVPRICLKREMAITLKQPDKMSNTNKGEITVRVAFEKREKVHSDVSLPVVRNNNTTWNNNNSLKEKCF